MFFASFFQRVSPVQAAGCLLLACIRVGAAILLTLLASTGFAQDVRVDSDVQVSPVNGGWYPWYELATGPSDSNHLIVCGSRWDVHDNAFYGFAYSSSDGGRTWQTALEDKSTTWVTEHSCAFGVDGKAYLLSEASKVVDGRPNHELGTTRVFSSHDAGRSWTEATRTSWADYSSSVVDTHLGPNQNRLYAFFHDFEANPHGQVQNKRTSSRISVISFKDGDADVAGPIDNPKMDLLSYQGAYPGRVFLLKDGALMALFLAARKTDDGLDDTINAVRLETDRLILTDPVTVVRAPITNTGCYPSRYAAAYDLAEDTVYLTYPVSIGGKCDLALKTSVDGGRTWREERLMPELGVESSGVYAPAMAINNTGVLGLIWRENRVSDCWYFSASRDKGKTFTPARPLSRCSTAQEELLGQASASLRMSAGRAVNDGQPPPSSSNRQDTLVLNVVDSRNAVWRNTGALTATADNVFHAVWVEKGHGEGQLRSARIIVGETYAEPSFLPQLHQGETRDVTKDVTLLYGGDQHYDTRNGTLTLDVVLKNKGRESLRGPLFMEVLALTGDLSGLEIANSCNRVVGPGATWDLSDTLSNGILAPGATTEPYSLVFRFLEKSAPARETGIMSMKVVVLTRSTGARAEH